jgi:phosphoribosyl-dephospho-CoA transferase
VFSRHDLVWLTHEGWRAASARAQPRERAAIALWASQDWPATVRRQDFHAGAGSVSLGLSLPPDPVDGTKPKIALHARREQVARWSPPLPLADAIACAPVQWRAMLTHLVDTARPACLRTYGSLALQAITGRPYLTASSDIDLVFQPLTAGQLDAVIKLLAAQAEQLPLDGEVVFPTGDAVAWKEWRSVRDGAARVLVKSMDGVRLAESATLLAALGKQ